MLLQANGCRADTLPIFRHLSPSVSFTQCLRRIAYQAGLAVALIGTPTVGQAQQLPDWVIGLKREGNIQYRLHNSPGNYLVDQAGANGFECPAYFQGPEGNVGQSKYSSARICLESSPFLLQGVDSRGFMIQSLIGLDMSGGVLPSPGQLLFTNTSATISVRDTFQVMNPRTADGQRAIFRLTAPMQPLPIFIDPMGRDIRWAYGPDRSDPNHIVNRWRNPGFHPWKYTITFRTDDGIVLKVVEAQTTLVDIPFEALIPAGRTERFRPGDMLTVEVKATGSCGVMSEIKRNICGSAISYGVLYAPVIKGL